MNSEIIINAIGKETGDWFWAAFSFFVFWVGTLYLCVQKNKLMNKLDKKISRLSRLNKINRLDKKISGLKKKIKKLK